MKFININEHRPNCGQQVLIKTIEKWLPYYVCFYYEAERGNFFEEAGGEQYTTWKEDEVQGWLPIEDIEKEPVYCKDCKNRYDEWECPLAEQHESYNEDDGWDYYYTYGASKEDGFYCAYGEKEVNE